jgi:hypothetical protein
MIVPNDAYVFITQAPIPAGQISFDALMHPLIGWIVLLALTATCVAFWFASERRKMGRRPGQPRPLRLVHSGRVITPQQA